VNRPRRMAAVAAVAAAAVLVAMPPGMSGADSHGDPEREVARAIEELEHATGREQRALDRYVEATEELPKAEARSQEIRQHVERALAAVEEATGEEEAAARRLTRATARHERLQADVEQAQDRIDAIAVAAYKGRGIYAFNSVVASGSPSDLVNRLSFLEQIGAQERQALADLAAAKERAGQALEQARDAQLAAESARQGAEEALADARAAQARAEEAAAEVEDLIATRAEALDEAKQERERAEAEKARVEAELREWEEANWDTAPELQPGATLVMPVAGVKTSDYGWRHHPVYDEPRLHTGVDFAAPGGTAIWSAADGVVMQAGWNGGYGYFTCVSHGTYDGQGMSTCYAHQSEILVSVDQPVEAGELIGRVGTTGTSTGDHLHFEVRLDGSPVDPLPWLPDCLC
jgi:murein DD-endopeptidase MepM/ murein hydrolase activator NlpD